MDGSCLDSNIPGNASTSILFDKVLPSLVTGLLFGGIPPFILHISNLKSAEFRKGRFFSLVNLFCPNLMSDRLLTF